MPKWYDNIPKEGILCWVWSDNVVDRFPTPIVQYVDSPFGKFKSIRDGIWEHAVPIRPEECYQGESN